MIPDHGQWFFCARAIRQILSYHEFQMRRVVGVFLILLFWLGPLAAVLPANAESRLPACCRRNGAHHCALSAASHPYSGGSPVFAHPSQCPSFPDSVIASRVSVLPWPPARRGFRFLLPVLIGRLRTLPEPSRANPAAAPAADLPPPQSIENRVDDLVLVPDRGTDPRLRLPSTQWLNAYGGASPKSNRLRHLKNFPGGQHPHAFQFSHWRDSCVCRFIACDGDCFRHFAWRGSRPTSSAYPGGLGHTSGGR